MQNSMIMHVHMYVTTASSEPHLASEGGIVGEALRDKLSDTLLVLGLLCGLVGTDTHVSNLHQHTPV